MQTTNQTNNQSNISLSYCLYKLFIDGQVISYKTTWNSRNYREPEFRAIPERNPMIERLIMTVNSKLIDFHYYHRKVYEYSIDTGHYHARVYDYDTKENLIDVLHYALHYSDELFITILKEGWQKHLRYLEMALTLMHNTYALLEELGVHYNPDIEFNELVTTAFSSDN